MTSALSESAKRLSSPPSGWAEANAQADIANLLRTADIGLDTSDLRLESPTDDRRRIDIEVGRTVIEVKRSLRRTDLLSAGEAQLTAYLKDRQSGSAERFVGVLTDGEEWRLYHLTTAGELSLVSRFTNKGEAHSLVIWLEGALATKQDIPASPEEITARVGTESSSFQLDFAALSDIYHATREEPEVEVKRELWERLLRDALGMGFAKLSEGEKDTLFVRHTYLVVVAEVIAHLVIGVDVVTAKPEHLTSGALFRQQQIRGVVESDFFDWVTDSEPGRQFVRTLARRLARFDFSHPEHDVLKVLYESVIDPETRHSLGEYYTPDWLAEQIIIEVVDDPLDQRVLDPSCGSGTFLFWRIRRGLEIAEKRGLTADEAISRLTERTVGIDLHPVAVTLASVTVLLAIGHERLKQRKPFGVNVFLGDSMMWRQPEGLHGAGGLTIHTSDGLTLFDDSIIFPEQLVENIAAFDRLVADLSDRATSRKPGSAVPSLSGVVRANAVPVEHRKAVEDAFITLCRLHDERRNHIWGFYIRNLARPFYLSHKKVDRLVGNPPWLAFRFMDEDLKTRFKDATQKRSLWSGGTDATHQDLAGYFVARSVERFLAPGSRFGFVMPAGVLKGRQYAGFRTGNWSAANETTNYVRLDDRPPWRLVDVKPDPFPVPSCVIFGARDADAYAPLPALSENWQGRLPRGGNHDWNTVKPLITKSVHETRIPTGAGSAYRSDFIQGANLVPRLLLFVEPDEAASSIGAGSGMRYVRSYRSALEKAPWRDLDSLRGNIESRFVKPVHLGETVLPFRLLAPMEAIIPWDGSRLLTGEDPEIELYPGLAEWWRAAERIRVEHAPAGLDLNAQINYRNKLSQQLPPADLRVVYTKSGTNLTAALVDDPECVIDHLLYWAPVGSVDEGRYLSGILNSNTLLDEVQDYQPVGQFGPRHFDKYVFEPEFPRFDADRPEHIQLVDQVANAEHLAAETDIEGLGFQKARAVVREILLNEGILDEIDKLVSEILLAAAAEDDASL